MATAAGPKGQIAATESKRSSLQVDLWLFILMLGLALIGVAVTEMEHAGGKLYWLFLVLVYAGISVVRAWQTAKGRDAPVWPMIRAQVLHWLGPWWPSTSSSTTSRWTPLTGGRRRTTHS